MKERAIENHEQLAKVVTDLSKLADYMPFVVTITSGKKIRSTAANARHWANIEDFMNQINEAVEKVSEYTGYTPLETKKVISLSLPSEHIEILYARSKEAVHLGLKHICNIPTSTRLGTAEFSKFDDILEATIAEIIGEINDLSRKVLS